MGFKQTLLNFFGVLGQYLKVLFNDAVHKELAAVLPIATRAIAQIAADPTLLSSNDKRDAALAAIGAELLASQIKVGKSVLNLGLELAYQEFVQKQAATPASK